MQERCSRVGSLVAVQVGQCRSEERARIRGGVIGERKGGPDGDQLTDAPTAPVDAVGVAGL